MTDPQPYSGNRSSLNVCPWCGSAKGVTHLELASTHYNDRGASWLGYPGGSNPVAIVTHADCPESGYAIDLKRLCADPEGWHRHIREKTWNCLEYQRAIDTVVRLHGRWRKPKGRPDE